MFNKFHGLISGEKFTWAKKNEERFSLAYVLKLAELSEEKFNLLENFLYVLSVKKEPSNVAEPEKFVTTDNADDVISTASEAEQRKDTTDCSRKVLHPPQMRAIALYGRRALFRRCYYDRLLQLREQERIKKEREDYAKQKMREALRILQGY